MRNLPVESLRPFIETVSASLAQRRFSTLLLALFAALAMALAAVGIYGLINYWVRVREDEIAIRMALGAPRPAILRWAGWQALRLSLIGAAIGMLAGWAVSRWLESLVFGVPARNFTTLAAAALAVIGYNHGSGGPSCLARHAGGSHRQTASRLTIVVFVTPRTYRAPIMNYRFRIRATRYCLSDVGVSACPGSGACPAAGHGLRGIAGSLRLRRQSGRRCRTILLPPDGPLARRTEMRPQAGHRRSGMAQCLLGGVRSGGRPQAARRLGRGCVRFSPRNCAP